MHNRCQKQFYDPIRTEPSEANNVCYIRGLTVFRTDCQHKTCKTREFFVKSKAFNIELSTHKHWRTALLFGADNREPMFESQRKAWRVVSQSSATDKLIAGLYTSWNSYFSTAVQQLWAESESTAFPSRPLTHGIYYSNASPLQSICRTACAQTSGFNIEFVGLNVGDQRLECLDWIFDVIANKKLYNIALDCIYRIALYISLLHCILYDYFIFIIIIVCLIYDNQTPVLLGTEQHNSAVQLCLPIRPSN